jgi:hypothetical protein
MKKLLYVLLAMTMAFAMIGCPTDDDGDDTTPVPAAPVYTVGGPGGVAQDRTGTFSLLKDGTAVSGAVTYTVEAVTGSKDAATTFSAAVLSVARAETVGTGRLKITATSDDDPTATATKNINVIRLVTISFYVDEDKTTAVTDKPTIELEAGQTFTLAGEALPAKPTKSGFKFGRWEEDPTTAVTVDSSFQTDTDVYATWGSETLTVDSSAKVKAALENGSHILVKFDISDAGFNWNDYEGVAVPYKISAAAAVTQTRAVRLYGVYTDDDFTTPDANGVPIINLSDKNAPYIMNDKDMGYSTDYAGKLGYTAADTWFTVTYPIDGTGKNSGYDNKNLPGGENNSDATTVYFGVGLAGVNVDSNPVWDDRVVVQLLGETKLIAKAASGKTDIVGTFDYGSGKIAFVGYKDPIHDSFASLNVNDPVTRPVYVPPATGATPATADFTVTLSTPLPINAPDELTGQNYQPVHFIPITFPLQAGEQLSLGSYLKYTVRVKFYDEDGVTEDTGDTNGQYWGYGNCVFVKDITSLAEYVAVQPNSGDADNPNTLAAEYNLGQQTIGRNIPAAALADEAEFVGFVLTNGEKGAPVVEVVEIKFHFE